MAKLNEGDVIEGIFALALSEIFAYGKIDKQRLNKARTKIEPEMFKDGRYEVVIRDELGGGKGFQTNSFPPDIQKIIEDAFDESIPYLFNLQREMDAVQTQAFKDNGMVLSTLPPEDLAKVKQLAQVAIDSWVNLKPDEEDARRQLVSDFLDVVARTTVPSGWEYDSRMYFK